jgi:hypothetical protein
MNYFFSNRDRNNLNNKILALEEKNGFASPKNSVSSKKNQI